MTDEFRTEELLSMMKKISLNLTSQLEVYLRHQDMSGIQVYLLVYILRHHPEGTYLTELCHEIGVSKPTLSALIKKLREKGYLDFQENPGDIRKKKVLPTEKLMEEGEAFLQKACRMEKEIYSVFDGKEKEQLWDLEQKLLIRLSEMERNENRQEVILQ